MMQPTILLFDLDGTLVNTGGVGRKAFKQSLAHCYGRDDACDSIEFAGCTDFAIMRQALEAIEQEPSPERIQSTLDVYLGFLEERLQHASDYQVLQGVRPLLDALSTHSHLALGLGTGNVEKGAKLKLAPAKLDGFFSFGGFGSDAEDRTLLLDIGRTRGAKKLQRSAAECRTIVIGDTPRDVIAAKELGAEVIAVASGGYDLSTLASYAPTHAFETLDELAIELLI
ncbi:MAG: HAD hydrolase-like protein [Myxococcales bacterium]|nr:MAG: HAD hydrolase-like protein [Myxococcales bacterium]